MYITQYSEIYFQKENTSGSGDSVSGSFSEAADGIEVALTITTLTFGFRRTQGPVPSIIATCLAGDFRQPLCQQLQLPRFQAGIQQVVAVLLGNHLKIERFLFSAFHRQSLLNSMPGLRNPLTCGDVCMHRIAELFCLDVWNFKSRNCIARRNIALWVVISAKFN